jgi:hypothetical protein
MKCRIKNDVDPKTHINTIHFFDTIDYLNSSNGMMSYSLNEVKIEFVYNLITFALKTETYAVFVELERCINNEKRDLNSPNIYIHKSNNFYKKVSEYCEKEYCTGLKFCQNKLFKKCCLYPFRNIEKNIKEDDIIEKDKISKSTRVPLNYYNNYDKNYPKSSQGTSSTYTHFLIDTSNKEILCEYNNWDDYFHTTNFDLKKCIFFYKLIYYFYHKNNSTEEKQKEIDLYLKSLLLKFFKVSSKDIKAIMDSFWDCTEIDRLIKCLFDYKILNIFTA